MLKIIGDIAHIAAELNLTPQLIGTNGADSQEQLTYWAHTQGVTLRATCTPEQLTRLESLAHQLYTCENRDGWSLLFDASIPVAQAAFIYPDRFLLARTAVGNSLLYDLTIIDLQYSKICDAAKIPQPEIIIAQPSVIKRFPGYMPPPLYE